MTDTNSNNLGVNTDVILSNLCELLTNTVNMTSVFYDVFLNPNPMDVTLEQYDDNNELIKVTIPNRAKDKILSKIGEGNPEGEVTAPAGTMYIDALTSRIYVKVSGDDAFGWVPLITSDDIIEILWDYLLDNDFVTVGYLVEHEYVTRSDRATPAKAGVITYDNLSIKENDEAQLQTVGVIDQSNNVNKLWVGIKEEYDAITEKDPDTFYVVTDDDYDEPEEPEVEEIGD